MVKIIFHGDYSEATKEIDYDLAAKSNNDDFQSILAEILVNFSISTETEFYSLMQIKTMKFITNKQWHASVNNINENDSVLQLVDVRLFSNECINNLQDCYKTALLNKLETSRLKLLVFRLNDLLNSDIFCEEFIAFRGMQVLILIINDFSLYRNIESYALNCLCKTMTYLNGLEYIKFHGKNIIDMLFSFLRVKQNAIVIRGALFMLHIICEYSNHVLDIPYFDVVECLNYGDLDIVSNALKLINASIKKANTFQTKKVLCNKLFEIGIIDKLLALKNTTNRHEINELLFEFQKLIENVIPSSELNVFILKTQIQKLHKIIKHQEAQMKEMKQKYAMIDVLNDEFIRYHAALNDAYDSGLLINSVSKTAKQRRRDTTLNVKQNAFELINEMHETRQHIEKIRSENINLQTIIVDVTHKNETLRIQIADLHKTHTEIQQRYENSETKNKVLMEELKSSKENNQRLSCDIQTARCSISQLEDTISQQTIPKPKPVRNAGRAALMAAITKKKKHIDSNTQASSPPKLRRANVALLASIRSVKNENNVEHASSRMPPAHSALMAAICGDASKTKKPVRKKIVRKQETEIVTNKPTIKPGKAMKTLHWKRKIVSDEQKTDRVWNKVDEIKLFNKNEFEELFCVKKAKTATNQKKKVVKSVKKETKTSCLPKMRAQHLGILLSSLPALDGLKENILNVNNEILVTDKLEMILNKFPTNQEITSIKEFATNQKTPIIWDEPEAFCLLMDSISHMKNRLNSWLYINKFDASFDSVYESLTIYNAACTELFENDELANIFSLILTFGNYMNGGTNKGEADGFDIEILKKLENIKSSKKTFTLFDYVVKCYMDSNRNKQCVIADTLKHVILCTHKGKLSEIKIKCVTLIRRFKSMQNDRKLYETNEAFFKFMSVFMDKHGSKMEKLQKLLDETVDNYTKTVRFYDDLNRKHLNKSEEFMRIFADFAVGFDKKITIQKENKLKHDQNKSGKETNHRKHNLGQKIPNILQKSSKPKGLLINELKTALSVKKAVL